jgi:hypothetical protein
LGKAGGPGLATHTQPDPRATSKIADDTHACPMYARTRPASQPHTAVPTTARRPPAPAPAGTAYQECRTHTTETESCCTYQQHLLIDLQGCTCLLCYLRCSISNEHGHCQTRVSAYVRTYVLVQEQLRRACVRTCMISDDEIEICMACSQLVQVQPRLPHKDAYLR